MPTPDFCTSSELHRNSPRWFMTPSQSKNTPKASYKQLQSTPPLLETGRGRGVGNSPMSLSHIELQCTSGIGIPIVNDASSLPKIILELRTKTLETEALDSRPQGFSFSCLVGRVHIIFPTHQCAETMTMTKISSRMTCLMVIVICNLLSKQTHSRVAGRRVVLGWAKMRRKRLVLWKRSRHSLSVQ